MEVAAALLDASRKLTEKEQGSTGNVSTVSSSSWNSSNNELSDKNPNNTSPTSWFSSPWTGQRKRALSETVSSSEKQATMSWLGIFPPGQKPDQDCHTININIPNLDNKTRTRRTSYKGVETAMAGGLGKVWYDS